MHGRLFFTRRLIVVQDRKLWVKGRRLHHGLTGEVLFFVGGGLACLGALMMAHDYRDRGVWWEDYRATKVKQSPAFA